MQTHRVWNALNLIHQLDCVIKIIAGAKEINKQQLAAGCGLLPVS